MIFPHHKGYRCSSYTADFHAQAPVVWKVISSTHIENVLVVPSGSDVLRLFVVAVACLNRVNEDARFSFLAINHFINISMPYARPWAVEDKALSMTQVWAALSVSGGCRLRWRTVFYHIVCKNLRQTVRMYFPDANSGRDFLD